MANLKMNGLELGTITDVDVLPVSNINPHIFYRMENNLYVYDPISETWTNITEYALMVGATETDDGVSGIVPDPPKTDGGAPRVLLSSGEWGDSGCYGGRLSDGPSGTGGWQHRLRYPLNSAFHGKKLDASKTTVFSINFYAKEILGTEDTYLCEAYLIVTPIAPYPTMHLTLMMTFCGENNNIMYGASQYDMVYSEASGITEEALETLSYNLTSNFFKPGADSSYTYLKKATGPLGYKGERQYERHNNLLLKNSQYVTNFTVNGTTYDFGLLKTTLVAQYESVCNRSIIMQEVIVAEKRDEVSGGYYPIKFRRYGYTYRMEIDTIPEYISGAMWDKWTVVYAVDNSIMMVTKDEYDKLEDYDSIHPRIIYVIND